MNVTPSYDSDDERMAVLYPTSQKRLADGTTQKAFAVMKRKLAEERDKEHGSSPKMAKQQKVHRTSILYTS